MDGTDTIEHTGDISEAMRRWKETVAPLSEADVNDRDASPLP